MRAESTYVTLTGILPSVHHHNRAGSAANKQRKKNEVCVRIKKSLISCMGLAVSKTAAKHANTALRVAIVLLLSIDEDGAEEAVGVDEVEVGGGGRGDL
jgi:hypothetical protein